MGIASGRFSILLSWERISWLTDFIDHADGQKASGLFHLWCGFCIPLLAALAKELIERPGILKNNKKPLYQFRCDGGVALLFALVPKLFRRISTSEMQMFGQALPAEHLQPFMANLTDMRVALFTADARRSFWLS